MPERSVTCTGYPWLLLPIVADCGCQQSAAVRFRHGDLLLTRVLHPVVVRGRHDDGLSPQSTLRSDPTQIVQPCRIGTVPVRVRSHGASRRQPANSEPPSQGAHRRRSPHARAKGEMGVLLRVRRCSGRTQRFPRSHRYRDPVTRRQPRSHRRHLTMSQS